MDNPETELSTPAKKPPRKPRPSELAAKAAKAKKTKAPAKKMRGAPLRDHFKRVKPDRRPKRKAKTGVVRSERLDLRLSKAEKAKLVAKAKRLRRTTTSLVVEAIEKIK